MAAYAAASREGGLLTSSFTVAGNCSQRSGSRSRSRRGTPKGRGTLRVRGHGDLQFKCIGSRVCRKRSHLDIVSLHRLTCTPPGRPVAGSRRASVYTCMHIYMFPPQPCAFQRNINRGPGRLAPSREILTKYIDIWTCTYIRQAFITNGIHIHECMYKPWMHACTGRYRGPARGTEVYLEGRSGPRSITVKLVI